MTRHLLALISALLISSSIFASQPVKTDWKAEWITKAQSQGPTNSWIGYRKKVDIKTVPSRLDAHIAVDTKYWMWVNDSLVVYEGGLKRGPAIGDGYYDTVDIAPYLRKGENLIAILTWHLGKSGFSHMSSGNAAFLFEAIGGGVEILSDMSWESSEYLAYSTASGPVPNYRLPESNICFDARKSWGDWNKTSFGKRLGTPMILPFKPGDAPMGRLVARPVPQWRFSALKDYESVTRRGDTLACRLPYNCHISPWLKVKAPAGRRIGMQTDHRIVTGVETIRAEYITRDGEQEYESFGWMNGDWMYYIVPADVEVLAVKYRESGYDADFAGSFRCDDPLLNRYWEMAARTLYVCMRDTYYDCPDRERAQWWGDEVNEIGEAFYALSRSADKLALKGIYELVNWQRSDGTMYAPIPTSNYFQELPNQILASVGWYGFRNFAFYSGDDSFIKDIYAPVHRYLHEVWQLDADGLPIYRKGDWDWSDAGENVDKEALFIPWYYLALKAEAEYARKLGKEADALADEAAMARIAESFNRIFWNGSEYRSPAFSLPADDRVQAMAVVSGIAGPDKYKALSQVLDRERHSTVYMEKYALEALCMMGHPEIALSRMRGNYPTVMKEGVSTLWEHWNYDGSANHAWTGSGIMILSGKMAGIEPLEPGFKRFSLCPQMGDLKEIDCTVPSASGEIKVSLRRSGRRIRAVLTVPEGTQAYVPALGRSYGAGVHKINL